jgi:hypothetical protein
MGASDQASQPGAKVGTGGDQANQPGSKMGTSDQPNQPGAKMGTSDQANNQPGLPLFPLQSCYCRPQMYVKFVFCCGRM